jgi:hypothetical protein
VVEYVLNKKALGSTPNTIKNKKKERKKPEAGRSQVQGQPGLHSEFQDNLGYTVRFSQKTKRKDQVWWYAPRIPPYLGDRDRRIWV